MTKHVIDAARISPGRVATQVAVLLMGKNRTDYTRNAIPDVSVEVINTKDMAISQKMRVNKTYARHSGYPGGLTQESVQQVIDKKGEEEILRKAVYGMLPKNKLRPRMMKNLTIKK